MMMRKPAFSVTNVVLKVLTTEMDEEARAKEEGGAAKKIPKRCVVALWLTDIYSPAETWLHSHSRSLSTHSHFQ